MNTFYKGSIFLISLVTIVYFLQTLRLVYYHRKVLKVGNTIDNYTLFTTLVKFPKTDARVQWKTDLLYVYFVCTGGLLTKYKRYQEAHPEATFNRNPSPKFTTVKITGMTEIFSKASNNDTSSWTTTRLDAEVSEDLTRFANIITGFLLPVVINPIREQTRTNEEFYLVYHRAIDILISDEIQVPDKYIQRVIENWGEFAKAHKYQYEDLIDVLQHPSIRNW